MWNRYKLKVTKTQPTPVYTFWRFSNSLSGRGGRVILPPAPPELEIGLTLLNHSLHHRLHVTILYSVHIYFFDFVFSAFIQSNIFARFYVSFFTWKAKSTVLKWALSWFTLFIWRISSNYLSLESGLLVTTVISFNNSKFTNYIFNIISDFLWNIAWKNSFVL